MDVKVAWRAVCRRWVVVCLAALFGVAGGALLVVRATPSYVSSVAFFVSTPASDDASALAADQFATRRVNSYVRLASSDALASLVVGDSKVDLSAGRVAREISASADLNTVLLRVRVVDPDGPRSLRIASSVAKEFPTLVGSIDTTGTSSDKVRLTVVSGPSLSATPIRSSRVLTLGLGLFLGLVLGVAVALLRELMDTTVRSQELLASLTGLPVLGVVDFDEAAEGEPLLVGAQVHSVRAESFRQLRTNIQFTHVDSPVRVLVVTSPVSGEGKSTTSANLAVVFAEAGCRTLLIEADMRRPRVSDYFGLERSVGLSNVLAGQVDVREVLQPWGDGQLVVLASGSVPPNPSEMLGSRGMRDLLDGLRERFDMIIVDTPPLLPVTDAAVASVHADGVLVVVHSGRTTRAQVSSAMDALRGVEARVLGSLLNMAQRRSSAQGGYDGYGYYEDPPDTVLSTTEQPINKVRSKPRDTTTTPHPNEPTVDHSAPPSSTAIDVPSLEPVGGAAQSSIVAAKPVQRAVQQSTTRDHSPMVAGLRRRVRRA